MLQLVGDNKIGSESKLLVKAWATNDKRTHVYLLSEIAHIEKHQNPSRLNEFFNKLRDAKGTAANKVRMMRAYVLAFANVEMAGGKLDMKRIRDEDTGDKTKDIVKRSEAEFKAIFQKAAEISWVNFKEPAAAQEFEVNKYALTVLTRLFTETDMSVEDFEKLLETKVAEAKIAAAKAKARREQAEAVKAAEQKAIAEVTETATQKLRAVK